MLSLNMISLFIGGITGVFDIEELVWLLRKENLADIAVISIPKQLRYADFLVLVTAMSPRHSVAVTEYVIKTVSSFFLNLIYML